MAFRFRFPVKSCVAGTNYCCETCIYFCWADRACSTPFNTLKLCSTDGATYTGSDSLSGISATATYSDVDGWTVSYTCTGSSGSHTFGAGSTLPLEYDDGMGSYFNLSTSSTACNCPAIDCQNCLPQRTPITRQIYCTVSGWTICGHNFDGTFALSTTEDANNCWSYTGPPVTVSQNACGNSCQSGGNCTISLYALVCCGPSGLELHAYVTGGCGAGGELVGGIWFCTADALKSTSTTIPYPTCTDPTFGACDLGGGDAGNGVTFFY